MTKRLDAIAVATGLGFLFVAALVVTTWDPLDRADADVAVALNDVASTSPTYVRSFSLLTDVFQPWTFSIAVIVVAVILAARGHGGRGGWLLSVGGVGAASSWVLKRVLQRERPLVPSVVFEAPGYAFPSGHALHATLGSGLLAVAAWPYLGRAGRRVAVALSVLVAVGVSYSRIALGVHFVSDVLGGMLLGIWVLTTGLVVAGHAALGPARPFDPKAVASRAPPDRSSPG